jgi:hypothetical protein
MVSNIGLIGVHEMNESQLFLKTKNIDVDNMRHPDLIEIDIEKENLIFEESGLKKLIK